MKTFRKFLESTTNCKDGFNTINEDSNYNFLKYYNNVDFARAQLYQTESSIKEILNKVNLRDETVSEKDLDSLHKLFSELEKRSQEAAKNVQEWKNQEKRK